MQILSRSMPGDHLNSTSFARRHGEALIQHLPITRTWTFPSLQLGMHSRIEAQSSIRVQIRKAW